MPVYNRFPYWIEEIYRKYYAMKLTLEATSFDLTINTNSINDSIDIRYMIDKAFTKNPIVRFLYDGT